MFQVFKKDELQVIADLCIKYDVWIQIRPNILLGRIWVQTVCKGYQQMTLAVNELTLYMLANFAYFFNSLKT